MSDTTRVASEWAVRYADGDIDECGDRHEAEREVANAIHHFANGHDEYEGAHVVVRTVTATVSDWKAPNV